MGREIQRRRCGGHAHVDRCRDARIIDDQVHVANGPAEQAAVGAKAAVATYSPLFYVHWRLARETRAQLPAEYPERAAFVASGSIEADGHRADPGRMLVFAPGAPVTFTALTDATVMLLGGEPIGERYIEWNFVSSSKARIEQAKADWRAGRMKLPIHDDREFIPLPGDPPPPPNPMS